MAREKTTYPQNQFCNSVNEEISNSEYLEGNDTADTTEMDREDLTPHAAAPVKSLPTLYAILGGDDDDDLADEDDDDLDFDDDDLDEDLDVDDADMDDADIDEDFDDDDDLDDDLALDDDDDDEDEDVV